jgi:hypothetical protein
MFHVSLQFEVSPMLNRCKNKHLDAALRCFEQADPRELVSFHAVALELEYLAAYLVRRHVSFRSSPMLTYV